jgi:hypothetical protein
MRYIRTGFKFLCRLNSYRLQQPKFEGDFWREGIRKFQRYICYMWFKYNIHLNLKGTSYELLQNIATEW